MAGRFDSKSFNAEAFKYKVGHAPNLKRNELVKSQAIVTSDEDISASFRQDGTHYSRLAMKGIIDGEANNYDGKTDIDTSSTTTYEQGVIVVGRSKGWEEQDFSYDITGGQDFMGNIAGQVSDYKQTLDQGILLAALEGIFAMTDEEGTKFVASHTMDISASKAPTVGATTINTAMQRACGDNKSKFALAIMHSAVATDYENLQLLQYMKFTDASGIQRDLALGTINGRLVLIDDSMPVNGNKFTTYLLGTGALSLIDVGVKVPYEMSRDPKTKGGVDMLWMRQRKTLAAYGLSYEKKVQASLSPTNAELKNGSNWMLVNDQTDGAAKYIDSKAITIARIISQVAAS